MPIMDGYETAAWIRKEQPLNQYKKKSFTLMNWLETNSSIMFPMKKMKVNKQHCS
jgi:hypothetical protein